MDGRSVKSVMRQKGYNKSGIVSHCISDRMQLGNTGTDLVSQRLVIGSGWFVILCKEPGN